ncbi:putative Glycosyltransferase family 8 protein [Seiridium unicorne]|uniref:Glycosyltransferase family 8 protein n=1 Tax=Seiridium unicorne TaxID=138068 RepID=A0ABR2UYV3_9PEZI
MAPLWGSLSSLYQQYSPLATSESSNGAASADSLNSLKVRPSIGQILMSKRVRYTGTALAAIALFVLAFRNYDSLPSLDTLKSGYGAAPSNPNSNCPTASVPASYDDSHINWSRFAYTQYVTNQAYLCNSVMIFETLYRLGSKADRVMMYPESMMDPTATEGTTEAAKLLIKARDVYKVRLHPVAVQRRAGGDSTWAESFTKLLAFNQTQYERVLNVDSDATILQTMDELFLMPPCPVAMPRAYWLFPDSKILSSQLMLVQPSAVEFDRIQKKVSEAGKNDYDMEIVNQLYIDQAMILPHRPYDLLTGEFRGDNHEKYLGTDREEWDPVAVFNEAKFLHFSDWPVPKPWIPMQESMRKDKQPQCVQKNGAEDCSARELWNGFYTDFTDRRAKVCNTKSSSRR